MAFVYVQEIPSGLDLANKMLIESAHAKMLLDFSTGYIYATNMTWNSPSHTAYTSKEQDLQDLFYGLNGQTLQEITDSGKLATINEFIRTRRDDPIQKKRGGRHDMEGTSVIKTPIPNGTPIKYRNNFYQIITSEFALGQWIYVVDIPKRGTMYEHMEFRGAGMPTPAGNFIYVIEESLRLSPDGRTYILHDDLSTLFKTYGLSALWTMSAGLVSNFALNIWQGTANYLSGLTALPMLVGQVGQRSWNLPWNWWAGRAVADATRLAGGPGGGLMTRIGQTAYGFTRIGGVAALPAVAVAVSLALNVDLWGETVQVTWDSVPTASDVTTAAAAGLRGAAGLTVGTAKTAGRAVGAILTGVGDELSPGITQALSSASMTIAVVVGSLLALAVFKAPK